MTLSDCELDRRLDALDRSCAPPELVWQEIERQLDIPRGQPRRRWMALAAAFSALAIAAALVLQPVRPPGESGLIESGLVESANQPTALQASSRGAGAPSLQRSRLAVARARAENAAAIRMLEAALERETGNHLLMEFLAEARFREADLSATAARLEAPNKH